MKSTGTRRIPRDGETRPRPPIVTPTFASQVADTPRGARPLDGDTTKGWRSLKAPYLDRLVREPAPDLALVSLDDVEDVPISRDHDAVETLGDRLVGEGSEWRTAVNYSAINRLMPELAAEPGAGHSGAWSAPAIRG